eukprot:364750-Chlamydomonas_euryale.AAC.13
MDGRDSDGRRRARAPSRRRRLSGLSTCSRPAHPSDAQRGARRSKCRMRCPAALNLRKARAPEQASGSSGRPRRQLSLAPSRHTAGPRLAYADRSRQDQAMSTAAQREQRAAAGVGRLASQPARSAIARVRRRARASGSGPPAAQRSVRLPVLIAAALLLAAATPSASAHRRPLWLRDHLKKPAPAPDTIIVVPVPTQLAAAAAPVPAPMVQPTQLLAAPAPVPAPAPAAAPVIAVARAEVNYAPTPAPVVMMQPQQLAAAPAPVPAPAPAPVVVMVPAPEPVKDKCVKPWLC